VIVFITARYLQKGTLPNRGYMLMSELRRLITDLSHERSGFNSRVAHVGFDVNEVASAFPRIRLDSR